MHTKGKSSNQHAMSLNMPSPGLQTAPAGEFRILRLKRKRNEEPLDGLLIEAALKAAELAPECTSPNEARRPIKKRKKRNSNAAQVSLDSLASSQQPQSSQSQLHPQQVPQSKGMFQYAATITDVKDAEWEDPKWRKQLEDRLKTMAATGGGGSPTKEGNKGTNEAQSSSHGHHHQHPKRYAVKLAPKVAKASSKVTTKSTTVTVTKTSAPGVDIVEVEMYDAVSVKTSSDDSSSEDHDVKKKAKASSKAKPTQPEQVPDEVAAFLPMLEEYLRINDTPAKIYPDSKGGQGSKIGLNANDDEDDEYVWDVYYHRPLTLSEWNNMDAWGNGAAGAYSGEGGRVFGTLTGLPPSGVMDPDELSDGDSDDSSIDDEADEDSNAEEWYQNEYPEEEEEVSDEFDDDDDEFYDGRDDSEEEPDYDRHYGRY